MENPQYFNQNDKIDRYLDEMADEYKQLLLRALIVRSGSIDNLSVSDLIRLDNKVKRPLMDMSRWQRIYRLYFSVGVFSSALGILCLLFYGIFHNMLSDESEMSYFLPLFGIAFMVVGLTYCALSIIMPQIRNSRKRKSEVSDSDVVPLLSYEVITKWRDVEGIVSDLGGGNDIVSGSVIGYLLENSMIDDEEADALKSLLKLRNKISHSNDVPPLEEIQVIIKNADQVLNKLKKML